jgi:hypothetical protein
MDLGEGSCLYDQRYEKANFSGMRSILSYPVKASASVRHGEPKRGEIGEK